MERARGGTVTSEGVAGKSTADKLLAVRAEKTAAEKAEEAELEELRRCANRLFSTRDGKFWARKAIKALGVYRRDSSVLGYPALLVAEKANYHFFLKFFKELLEPEVLLNIERGEK